MKPADKAQFRAEKSKLDLEKYLLLTYSFVTDADPEEAALHMCQEQSTAQWKRVGVDEDFRPTYGAKLLDLKILEQKDSKSRCQATIAHPHINFGDKITNMMTAILGEGVFYVPGILAAKLLNIEFPNSFLAKFQGPKFGIKGVRDLLGITNRPIFLGVVKPNIGLSPKDFASLAYESWLGGLDIPKDDEMLADAPYSSLIERTKLLGELRQKAEKITGEKKMFLANISDEADLIETNYRIATENGVNAVMLNSAATGLSIARALRKKTTAPLAGHFAGMSSFTQAPDFGISTPVWMKLQRLAGFDMIFFPGLNPRMHTTEEEMLANIKACVEPFGPIPAALPVIGGSDWAGTLPKLYKKIGSIDFGIVCGRGVFGHPGGPKGGAASLRQSWDAIEKKIPLEEYAKTHKELQQAIEAFGPL